MLCLALGLSTNEQVIRVVAGLPINQYKSIEKDKMEQLILDNKMLNFKLNGVQRQIIIENCSITAEGIATYYSLPSEQRKELKDRDIVILDIGGRTTDIALVKAGKKRIIGQSTSLEIGMINIYKDIINEVNSKHTLGLDIEDAEYILKHGLEVDGEKQDTEFIKDILMNNIKKIFKVLNVSYPVRTSPILVTGGGGEAFFKAIKRRYPTANMVNDHMFSNAIGYKKVGEKIMERLRIPLEFNKTKKEEIELYNKLQKHSNPAAYIKDVLLGLVPIPGQLVLLPNKEDTKIDTNDDEDLMDF